MSRGGEMESLHSAWLGSPRRPSGFTPRMLQSENSFLWVPASSGQKSYFSSQSGPLVAHIKHPLPPCYWFSQSPALPTRPGIPWREYRVLTASVLYVSSMGQDIRSIFITMRGSGTSKGLGVRLTWVWIPIQCLTGCLTFSKFLNLSEAQLHYLWDEKDSVYFIGLV